MSAKIFLHPRSVEYFGLYGMLSNLKTRGYEVPSMQGRRFYEAIPEPLPPPVRPPATVAQIERRLGFNKWWPRS